MLGRQRSPCLFVPDPEPERNHKLVRYFFINSEIVSVIEPGYHKTVQQCNKLRCPCSAKQEKKRMQLKRKKEMDSIDIISNYNKRGRIIFAGLAQIAISDYAKLKLKAETTFQLSSKRCNNDVFAFESAEQSFKDKGTGSQFSTTHCFTSCRFICMDGSNRKGKILDSNLTQVQKKNK
ncbi:hypothetical protein HELRODRAFT_160202 [Helobdella robusta]|uniref:Uncharacterized protein n=1 Tax=Helobdella robusta TaxID=6412 RepID=T1EPY8_HELRO|nr:hypothetical protein HELRODRAFT_160202 [Helobdella robusta]ESO06071.1 hypothetical protein HELRODRAFT_160202 [Helobdella robusta]